jgi:uncharacterized protein (TIGR03084 family)
VAPVTYRCPTHVGTLDGMTASDDIAAALAEQQAELSGLLSGLEESDWERPSPCEGWSVADVVLHLVQTNALAVASARGEFDDVNNGIGARGNMNVDDAAAEAVARERGASGAELREQWNTSVKQMRVALDACDPSTRVTWVAGQLSVRTLTTTRLAETWIHTNDVADALGVTLTPRPRLKHVARLAWRTLPYAFSRDGRELSGPVAFELVGPNGEAWDFVPDDAPVTTIRGDGVELCLVAARRVVPSDESLIGEGPDVAAVLELVRTYA